MTEQYPLASTPPTSPGGAGGSVSPASATSPQSSIGASAAGRSAASSLSTKSPSRSKRTSARMAMDGVPRHVIPLPPPPSDCDSANMSTGSVSLTVFSHDSPLHGRHEKPQQPETHVDRQSAPSVPPSPKSQLKVHLKSSLRPSHYNSETDSSTRHTNPAVPKEKKTSFSPLPPQERVIPDLPEKQRQATKTAKKRTCRRTALYCLFGVALCIVVVAIGVNLLIYYDSQDQQESQSTPQGEQGGNKELPEGYDAVVEDFINPRPAPVDTTGSPPPSTAVDNSTPLPTSAPTSTSDAIFELLATQFRIAIPVSDNSPVRQAVDWLASEVTSSNNGTNTLLDSYRNDLIQFAQRFALLCMRYALVGGKNLSSPTDDVTRFTRFPQVDVDECQWEGVVCNVNGQVIEIDYSDIGLNGRLPPEIRLLPYLEVLDLSHNEIQGSIPEEFYDLRRMKKVYLYMNLLSGSISTYVGQLDALEVLHMSHNSFSGRIPQELQSDGQDIRPLKMLNLHSNLLSGTIPNNLRLRQLVYLDLGRNRLTGTIPQDLGETFVRLRQLYLDNNGLTGSIPTTIPPMANGRLEIMEVNHNALSGSVPDNFIMFNKLVQYRLDNNNFDTLGPQNCQLSLFNDFGGELIEFKADCDICACNDQFCENMCDAQIGL